MTLTTFEAKIKPLCDSLAKVLKQPNQIRPFVCDGNPFGCKIFVVGYNPATPMPAVSYWSFWNNTTGFDYNGWLNSYQAAKRGSKSKTSQTRRVLNAIRLAAGSTLETNLYPIPTSKQRCLKDILTPLIRMMSYAILCELIRCIRPEVIIAHGTEASSLVHGLPCCSEKIGVNPLAEENETASSGIKIVNSEERAPDGSEKQDGFVVTVIAVPDHFGRGFSQDRGKRIGEQAASICRARSHSQ